MIKSKATPEKTKSYSDKFPKVRFKQFGSTGLEVSSCGFGSYRIDYRVREHVEALEYAILNGINLIDTSSNYSDGGSEILIGNVIKKLVEEKKISREEIIIVSKGGYIQGKNFEIASAKKQNGNPYPDVIEYTDKLWHCISPEFLKDQISLSLERLQLETIDAYLLHNPEYFLDSPLTKDLLPEELHHEYYNRIKKAFAFLETEVEAGRLGCYGISSNSFILNSDEQTFTSLETCFNIADNLKTENYFKVVQFPFNLYERGALAIKNQSGDSMTILDFIQEKHLGVMLNRPLNSISAKTLARLTDFEVNPEYFELDETQVVAEIGLLECMEDEFISEHIDSLKLEEKVKEAVVAFMKAGLLMKENWKNFNSIESYNDIKKQFLIPRENYAIGMILRSENITEEMKDKLNKIALQVNKVSGIIETIYGVKANMRSKEIHSKLNELIEDESFHKLSLSQKAILFLNSVESVSSTLVGMRQKKYVDDVLGILNHKPLTNAEEYFSNLSI